MMEDQTKQFIEDHLTDYAFGSSFERERNEKAINEFIEVLKKEIGLAFDHDYLRGTYEYELKQKSAPAN
ncbi:MAG: hypothetical protein KAR20_05175, partial [Candidatus Heimdallarchaeota archaeon]|nr:hypothetical protein [Candidatus Heimdallarchaeota archaeon]